MVRKDKSPSKVVTDTGRPTFVGKTRRNKSGTVAKREIKKLQKTTALIIPRAPIDRLIREIADNIDPELNNRFESGAIDALREGTEDYMTTLFDAGMRVMVNNNRKTLVPSDIQMVQKIVEIMYGRYVPLTTKELTLYQTVPKKKTKKKKKKKE